MGSIMSGHDVDVSRESHDALPPSPEGWMDRSVAWLPNLSQMWREEESVRLSGGGSDSEASVRLPSLEAERAATRGGGYSEHDAACHQYEWCLVFGGSEEVVARLDGLGVSSPEKCSMGVLRTRFEELGLSCSVPPPSAAHPLERFLLVGAGEVGSEASEDLLTREAERTGLLKTQIER